MLSTKSRRSAMPSSVPMSERMVRTLALPARTDAADGPYSNHVWWVKAWAFSARPMRPAPRTAMGNLKLCGLSCPLTPSGSMSRSTATKISWPPCGEASKET